MQFSAKVSEAPLASKLSALAFLLASLFMGPLAEAQQSAPMGIRPDGRVVSSGKNYRAFGGSDGWWCTRTGGSQPGWQAAFQIEFEPQVRVPKDPDWYVAFVQKALLPVARKHCGEPIMSVFTQHFWQGYKHKSLEWDMGAVGSGHLSKRAVEDSWKVSFQGLQSMAEHKARLAGEVKARQENEECAQLERLRREGRIANAPEKEKLLRRQTELAEEMWAGNYNDGSFRLAIDQLVDACSEAYLPACWTLQEKSKQADANCTGHAKGRKREPFACGLWAYILDTLPRLCFDNNLRFGAAGPDGHWIREAYKTACDGGVPFYCERLQMMDLPDPFAHLEMPG